MSLNFPTSPILGQTYTVDNKTWTWNGNVWVGASSAITANGKVIALAMIFG